MTVTIDEAKLRMDELAELAASGESVLICRGNLTFELKSLGQVTGETDQPFGLLAGKLAVGPEFFEPLSDQELDLWEGNSPRGRKIEGPLGKDYDEFLKSQSIAG